MAALKTGSPNQALLKLFVFFIQYNVLNASRIVHMMDIMCVCNGPPLIPIPWRRQCSAGSFVMCAPQRERKATCLKTINNVHFNLSFIKSIVRHSCPVFSDDAKKPLTTTITYCWSLMSLFIFDIPLDIPLEL